MQINKTQRSGFLKKKLLLTESWSTNNFRIWSFRYSELLATVTRSSHSPSQAFGIHHTLEHLRLTLWAEQEDKNKDIRGNNCKICSGAWGHDILKERDSIKTEQCICCRHVQGSKEERGRIEEEEGIFIASFQLPWTFGSSEV